MDRPQLDALARRYLSARFDHAEEWLSAPAIPPTATDREAVGFTLADEAATAAGALASGHYGSALDKARALLPDGDPDALAKLARRILEADIEACRAELRALSGEPLAYPSLAPAASVAANGEPKETPPLSAVIEQFAAERQASGAWRPRTNAAMRARLRLACELLGDPCIGDVTKDDMRQFGLDLAQMPSNPEKRYPGLTMRAILAAVTQDASAPRMAPKTVNMVLQQVRAVFAWAVDHDVIAVSPATVLRNAKQSRAREQRHPFTDGDIASLMAELARPMRTSRHSGQPWVHWIPRILALSGMRLGEVAQLRKCDVRKEQGVTVFDVNADDGKAVKNAASVRLVPVHPHLGELGLLAFIAAQPAGYLWPAELRTPSKPDRSLTDELSKWLMRRLRRAGVSDKRKGMHSFRHTVSARLSAASVPEYQIADLLGHENESMTTGRYGAGTPLPVLLGVLSKLTLPV